MPSVTELMQQMRSPAQPPPPRLRVVRRQKHSGVMRVGTILADSKVSLERRDLPDRRNAEVKRGAGEKARPCLVDPWSRDLWVILDGHAQGPETARW